MASLCLTKITKTVTGNRYLLPITPLPTSNMRLRLFQSAQAQSDLFTWPIACLLAAALTVSVSVVQSGFAQSTIATTPEAKAKEIAALAPATDKKGLRKEEIKEMSVVMSGVEKTLRSNIAKLLDIWQFHEKDIPSVARMRFMHRKAPEQIAAALRPYGYYRSTVDSRLSDLGAKWQAVYRITPGDRVAVKEAKVNITGPGADEPIFIRIQRFAEENIKSGGVLDQQLYDAIKQNILSAAAQLGYFDSDFLAQEILVDLEDYSANVTLNFQTGDRYRLGKITVNQDIDWLSDELLAKFIPLEEQSYFDANDLQQVQNDLSSTSYYRNVEVRASADTAVDGAIPVTVNLKHMNPKQYVTGIGYATNTGVRTRFGILRRRVNKEGHHYLAEAKWAEIGYGLGFAYTIPTRDPRTDSYGLSFNFEEQDPKSGQFGNITRFRNIGVGGNFRYKDNLWFKTYALNYQVEEDIDDDTVSTLLIPSIEWVRTSPEPLEQRINVDNGTWLRLFLRGASNDLFSDTSFLQGQISAKKIISYGNGNRLIGRASVGSTYVSDYSKLPESLRFSTGGDGTVRGYRYETIAPINAAGELQGGKHLAEISVEYEVQFRPNFSWAVFSDLGDAFDDKPDYRNGVGLGIRWRSPIGPIRLDAGRGLDSPSDGDWVFHLSIGPDL